VRIVCSRSMLAAICTSTRAGGPARESALPSSSATIASRPARPAVDEAVAPASGIA